MKSGLEAKLDDGLTEVREKYRFHDDFIKLSILDYRKFNNGYPKLSLEYQTTTEKLTGVAVNPSLELLEFHSEISELIEQRPDSLRFDLHAPLYILESSYKGKTIELRLVANTTTKVKSAQRWVQKANGLLEKSYETIVLRVRPE